MNFIFQYDYINLKYLDIQNKKLTNKGIRALQNESLKNIEYLNLSNNNIIDVGLTYLNYLSNLKELVLFNMNYLSDDYFLSLEENCFIKKIYLRSDKKKLSLKLIYPNYNNFFLSNLDCLKLIETSEKINLILNQLFQLNNLCSNIKELDLSNTGITDNGMIQLTNNISLFKNIELINLENTKITIKCKKYFEQIKKKNIKIKSNLSYPKYNYLEKNIYKIILGGSTISGKTTYIKSYINNFPDENYNNIDKDYYLIKNPKYENMKFKIYDTCRWNGAFDSIVLHILQIADAVILLFDISDKNDFCGLHHCLNMIQKHFDLEKFPVLLVGNKADLEKKVDKEEIENFVKFNNLIGYFEVSSKTFLNVDDSFDFMFNYLYEKKINCLNLKNDIKIKEK